jgi:uncharacterized repeat protein (TIGR02543 family)
MTGGFAQSPVAYSGTGWNDISSTPNYSVPALLDSNGNTTAVAFATISPTAMEGPFNWADHANVPLLQGGIKRNNNSSSGNAMNKRAQVSGLTAGNLYHIAVIGCWNDTAAGEWGIGTSTTAPTTTRTIINSLPLHEDWVAGNNHTIFYRVPADSGGNIYLWGKGQPGSGGYANGIVLNGLQVIDAADLASPENQMLSFSLPGVTAVINETAKTVTCSMYGEVNNLIPTLTMSSGATCSPASGVATDFTTPQVYTVYAEDGTPNAYTVTVNQLTPTLTTRGDGKTLATFTTTGGGVWTIPAGVSTVEAMVIGGGGGGGQQSSGGGAGGMYYTSSYTVTPGASVNVAVGTGGLGGNGPSAYNYYPGTNGALSQIGNLLAYGGQLGGSYSTGGNQGGYSPDNGATIIPGNNGGGGVAGNYAGGGGAGGIGGNTNGSSGGIGLQNAITGTNTYYAGGGGVASNGAGGLGGGGAGAANTLETTPGGPGVNGLGGGGGGGWGDAGGGAGGSGIVILAYLPGATTHTVSFDSNGGSSVASQEVPTDATATLPVPAPTRSGYTFAQWCSDSGLTTAFDFANTTITGPTTIYAKWLVNYTVSFESNGGSAVSSQTVPDGNTATEPTAPTLTGYTFGGWFTDSELTPPAFSFSTAITADTTLYAKWTINSYTLTYNAGSGGSISGTTPQTVDYLGSGTAVSAEPNPGWTFVKWSDNSTDNPRTDSNVTSNITVTATFQPPFPAISTRGDGYTLATFYEGSGTWTVPAGVTSVEVLVVGGGGGTTASFSSGSGAGGMYQSTTYSVTPEATVSVAVGAGGINGNGSNSVFGDLIAYGGTPGLGYTDGGDQGGYSLDGGTTIVPGNPGMHYSPMDGNWCTGGGAGHAGYKGDSQPGGIGLQCAITGSNLYYAGGGGGNAGGVNSGGLGGGGGGPSAFGGVSGSGTPNTGGGGGGGWGGGGGAGGSGVVIVAYFVGGATPYDTWAAGPFANAFTDTDPGSDPDGDGQTNHQEFAFGLDPTTGTSVNPIIVPLDKGTHKFRYTRYAPSGLDYTVWDSTDLQDWGVEPAAITEVKIDGPDANGVETWEVTLTSPPSGGQVFVRVRAQ